MTSSWRRYEVAIAVPAAPPIMRADAETTGRWEGAARHWALWYDETRLLVLRSSIPVRAGSPDIDGPAQRAVDWWRGQLKIVTLADVQQPLWVWPAEDDQ